MNARCGQKSWLVVPASRREQMDAARASDADVVVLDLVEFVAPKDKTLARLQVRDAIEACAAKGVPAYVQTDPQNMEADVSACAAARLAGIVLSRAESKEQVRKLSVLLDAYERATGMPLASIRIVAALETATGNHNAYAIACASSRVEALTLGRADLIMDLRPEPSGELHLMPYLMQRLVLIAGAAGKVPLGAWWRAPDRGLLATAKHTYEAGVRGRAIGFRGSLCITPSQVEPINKAYG
jgi:citrate lyase subunit beta / citryl-CoA lyase